MDSMSEFYIAHGVSKYGGKSIFGKIARADKISRRKTKKFLKIYSCTIGLPYILCCIFFLDFYNSRQFVTSLIMWIIICAVGAWQSGNYIDEAWEKIEAEDSKSA